jgi:hypothetical protein
MPQYNILAQNMLAASVVVEYCMVAMPDQMVTDSMKPASDHPPAWWRLVKATNATIAFNKVLIKLIITIGVMMAGMILVYHEQLLIESIRDS